MKRFWTTVSGLFLLGGVVSFFFTVEGAVQDSFWNEIAQGNMAEIAAGNLALQRSQNEQVRQFAQQMVTDHTSVGTELQTLAGSKNVTLPAATSTKAQSDINKLGGRSGADFDRDFMKMMVKDHERMVKLLEREAERNADADVKAFAAKNLPVVQGHLTMARSLNDSLRGSSGGNRSNTNRSNMNTDADTNTNANANTNANGNNSSNNSRGFSNLRPNVNRNANGNTNMNTNTNVNTNANANTGNVNDNRR